MTEDIYLYISVPFCLRRCNYCYCTTGFSDEDLFSWRDNSELYVESILKEISTFSGEGKRCLGTSFGGGTPSLLRVPQIEQIFNATMKCCTSINKKAQINLEIFPGTKSREELKSLHSIGFNRASIGAQSFDDEELRLLGRVHNKDAIYKTYDDLLAAGFENINFDIMFGLPTGSLSRWMKTVDSVLYLQPKHLTAYYWFIRVGSDFFKKIKEGQMKLKSREECIEQYRYVIEAAKEHGLSLYFDYNFSRGPEYENAIERDIFRLFSIRGFGPGAWSQEGRIRVFHYPNLQVYLKDQLNKLVIVQSADDYMLNVLMYPQGMIFTEFERFFKQRWATKLMGEKLRKSFIMWIDKNFIEIDDTGIRFKEETWEQSAIYLAELQTKIYHCSEKELSILTSNA
jgi:oxygen-independent coproporphyrinogen-3 oxidase